MAIGNHLLFHLSSQQPGCSLICTWYFIFYLFQDNSFFLFLPAKFHLNLNNTGFKHFHAHQINSNFYSSSRLLTNLLALAVGKITKSLPLKSFSKLSIKFLNRLGLNTPSWKLLLRQVDIHQLTWLVVLDLVRKDHPEA